MLHVTNGDCASDLLERAGLDGDVLPWRDVLHEGPVPAGLSLRELSDLRAAWLAASGWAPLERVRAQFAERDQVLEAVDEVVLWFEHDLYDQLQLIQILDALGARAPGSQLICIGAFPGVEPFHGLGQLSPEQLATLWPQRAPVGNARAALAREAWAAFRAPDPRAMDTLARDADGHGLPFLRGALLRALEELPAVGDGLARSERQALEAVAAGAARREDAFEAAQDREEARFMGDATFFDRLADLGGGPAPLVTGDGAGEPLALTDAGRAVLAGDADWIALRGGIDRWLGGTHLAGPVPAWRWDRAAGALVSG